MHSDGYRVIDPANVTWEQWQHLLTLDSRKARLNEYEYLGKRIIWRLNSRVSAPDRMTTADKIRRHLWFSFTAEKSKISGITSNTCQKTTRKKATRRPYYLWSRAHFNVFKDQWSDDGQGSKLEVIIEASRLKHMPNKKKTLPITGWHKRECLTSQGS